MKTWNKHKEFVEALGDTERPIFSRNAELFFSNKTGQPLAVIWWDIKEPTKLNLSPIFDVNQLTSRPEAIKIIEEALSSST